MNFRSNIALRQIAVRALLVGVCVSVAFGSDAHIVFASLLPTHSLVGNEGPLTHQSSVPEEAPPETPGSNEPIKEGEEPSFSPRKKSQKASRYHVQRSNLARFSNRYLSSAKASLVGSQTPSPQFEYCYRNGCGAHLRR